MYSAPEPEAARARRFLPMPSPGSADRAEETAGTRREAALRAPGMRFAFTLFAESELIMPRSIVPGLLGPATVVLTWTFLEPHSTAKIALVFCAAAGVVIALFGAAFGARSEPARDRPTPRGAARPSIRYSRANCLRGTSGQPRYPALHRPLRTNAPRVGPIPWSDESDGSAEAAAVTSVARPGTASIPR